MGKKPAELNFEEELNKLEKVIEASRTFFLAGHVNPDGDTIGCMLALGSVLKRLGKKVYLYSRDPAPDNLGFLRHVKSIKIARPPKGSFDAAILMECSTPERGGGDIKDVLKRVGTVVNIDHHKTSTAYGDVNVLDMHASSTAEIIYRLLYDMKVELNKTEATALYTGIVTDTGRFHFPATSPRTLDVAARLMQTGFKFSRINDLLYATKAFESLRVLGRALESLELLNGGRLAVMTLKHSDFEAFCARVEHSENVINYGTMIPGVRMSILFREDPERVNITFRSRGHADVSHLARQFGGGGHRNAAGCRMKATLAEAREKVLEAALPMLKPS